MCALILAGCGGSTKPETRIVHGPGFGFEAPAGWKTASTKTSASAAHDDELLQVTVFPLVKPYTDALYAKVAPELELRMRAVAKQVHGKLGAGTTVTAAGIRSHSYEVTTAGDVLDYTFTLRGRSEYQLLCRRPASASSSICDGLVSSFSLAAG